MGSMRKGIAVSPGVAVGTAYCIHDILLSPDQARLEDHQVAGELSAYEAAREKAAADLRALQTKVASQARAPRSGHILGSRSNPS